MGGGTFLCVTLDRETEGRAVAMSRARRTLNKSYPSGTNNSL